MKNDMTFDHLLQPLAQGSPCGVALLHEPEYDAIAAAREEDDPSLPRGVWTGELKRADWPQVVRLCEAALAGRSKDLQIAAWLGEAWIALDGLAGGVRATALLHALCERFWDGLHPLPRGGDIEFRTAPFDWADRHWSLALVLRVPLVVGGSPEPMAVTLAQWQEAAAADNDNLKKKKPAPDEAAPLTPTKILAQLAGMPAPDVIALLQLVQGWRAAVEGLHAAVARRDPAAAPRMPQLVAVLDGIEALLRHRDVDVPGGATAAILTPAAAAAAATVTAPEAGRGNGIPAGRDDAYYQLGVVADYLSRTEPHSPVPALLRRAIEWGQMPFADLMDELTHNNNEMQTLLLRKPLPRK